MHVKNVHPDNRLGISLDDFIFTEWSENTLRLNEIKY